MNQSRKPPAGTNDLAAREAALALLLGVFGRGQAVDERFDAAVAKLESRDRAFVRLLVATVLRRRGQIDTLLATLVQKRPPAMVEDILRLGLAQLLFLGTPPHAAVATSVELTKRKKQERLSGLVNAVLRRGAEQAPKLLSGQDAARRNTPAWLWQSWANAYGEAAAEAIGAAHLAEAPLDLTLKDPATAAEWAARLEGTALPTGSVRRLATGRVQEMAGFAEGAWWVQDAAATLPAKILLHALGDVKGRKVIDLCAAPGGKTLQLAAAGCAVTALDVSHDRLVRLRENLTRMNLAAAVVDGNALTWRPKELAAAVLLDAPCSATGTIRRHPDLIYLKRAADVAVFAENQYKLLMAALEMVRPGGVLVYSVCSLQPEECEQVVRTALAADVRLSRQAIPAVAVGGEAQFITPMGDVRTLPSHWAERGGVDGFYIALLRREE